MLLTKGLLASGPHTQPRRREMFFFRVKKSKIHRARNFGLEWNYNLEVIKTISFGFDLFIGWRVWDRLHQIAPWRKKKKKNSKFSFFIFLLKPLFLKNPFWFLIYHLLLVGDDDDF